MSSSSITMADHRLSLLPFKLLDDQQFQYTPGFVWEELMEERLKEAAQLGSINELYVILRQSPKILETIDQIPFIDTPLHISVSAGQTHFAAEILRLNPSFGKKLNPDGFSPLDMALRNNQLETVRWLVKINPQLIRVQGREGFTPLHYVAEMDQVDLLSLFLVACPGSIEDLTIYGETAVHVAVRNGRIASLKVLLGWLPRSGGGRKKVVNWTDDKNRTLLHMAAINNQPEVMRLLVKKVNKNEMDFEGSTALDIVLRFPEGVDKGPATEILRNEGALVAEALPNTIAMPQFLISPSGFLEVILKYLFYSQWGMSKEKRQILLVVAVLIMATTYQGLLTRPDAPRQGHDNTHMTNIDAHTIAKAITSNHHKVDDEISFDVFIFLNTIALLLSATLTLFHLRFSILLPLSLLFLLVSYAFRTLYKPRSITTALEYVVWLLYIYGGMSVLLFTLFISLRSRGVHYQWYDMIHKVYCCRKTRIGSSH